MASTNSILEGNSSRASGDGFGGLRSRRDKSQSFAISAKDLATKLIEAAKSGSIPAELIKYFQADNHKHISSNQFRARDHFNELIGKLAEDKKDSELASIFETSGFQHYFKAARKPFIGQMAGLAEGLYSFLTDKEGRTEAAAKIAGSILTDNGSDGKQIDLNHDRIEILRNNKTLASLYSAAVSLGLHEEIQGIIKGLKNGDDLSQLALTQEARKAEIENDLERIDSIVSKDTGSIYDGDKVVLSATSISSSEADKINAASKDGDLVKSGEKLNFYDWFVQLRLDATKESDKDLSQTVNRFIDKYIGVQKLRADVARESGLGAKAEKIEEDAQLFMSMLTTGSLGLPKSIRNLIQRGLDYSQGVDAVGNQILTNGTDSEVPKATLNDELRGFNKLVNKRGGIFGIVGHIGAIISGDSGAVTSYEVKKDAKGAIQIVPKTLNMVTDSDPRRGNTDSTTFSEAARGYKDVQESIATKVAAQFTKSIFDSEDFSKEALDKFIKDTLFTKTTTKALEINKTDDKKDYAAGFAKRVGVLAELIKNVDDTAGVARDIEPRELNAAITELVNKALSSSLSSGSLTPPETEIKRAIETFNEGVTDDTEKFSIKTLEDAVLEKNSDVINSELAKLRNIAQKVEVEYKNTKWNFTYNADKSESTSTDNTLAEAFNGDKIRNFVGRLIHDKNTPDPLRGVTSEHITTLIESNDELKDALLSSPDLHGSIEDFESLKKNPEIAGPEATVLFSDKAKLDNKSADVRAKFAVLLNLLKRTKDDGSVSESRFDEILGSVTDKFFAEELKRSAAKNPHLSDTEARKERKEELVTSLKSYLEDSSELARFADSTTETILETKVINSDTIKKAIASDDSEKIAQLINEAGSVIPDDHLDNLVNLRNAHRNLASANEELVDLQAELLRASVGDVGDINTEIAEIQAEIAEIQLDIDSCKAISTDDIASLNESIDIETTTGGSTISGIEEAAQLLTNAAYRRMTLSMANRAVIASEAEVAAARIGTKINTVKRDTNTTLEVISSVSDVISSHLSRLGEFENGNKVMSSIKKDLNDNLRAQNMISALANEDIQKLTEDKKYNPKDNIEDLLEKWTALLEALSYEIVPNAHEVADAEKARLQKGSGKQPGSSSKASAETKKEEAKPTSAKDLANADDNERQVQLG